MECEILTECDIFFVIQFKEHACEVCLQPGLTMTGHTGDTVELLNPAISPKTDNAWAIVYRKSRILIWYMFRSGRPDRDCPEL